MDEQNTNTAQESKVLSQEEIDKKIKFGLDILAGDVPMLRGDSAFRAFRAAALAGSAEGKARLADLYYRGVGTERNYEEALRLAEEAAYEENAFGQYILGTMYSDGRAFEKNYAEAFLWFGKAAGQGLPEALYRLGSCYYDGHGVERDLYKARQIFEKAAEADQPMAEAAVRRIDAVIVKDEQEEERYRKAVGGDRDSFVAILKDCVEKLEGHSCFENALSDKELDIIQKAETTDDPECEYLLSECYREITGNIYGDGLEEAVDKWIGHLKNSALEKGYAPALHKLGNLYRGDSYLEKDPEAAFRCYLQAAEDGYHDSMLYLSDCYENGIGTDKDFDLAMEWAKKAYDKAKASGMSTYPAGSRIHNLNIKKLETEVKQKKAEEKKKENGSFSLSNIWDLIDFNVYGILAAIGLYLFTVLFRALGAGLLTQPSINVHGLARFVLVLISAAGMFFGIFVSLLSIFTQIGIPFLAFYPSGLLWLFLVIELHDHAQYFTYMTYFALAVIAINFIFIAVRTIRKY